MKGVDPRFCMHRINLKKDAVPVISQRYRMNPNYAKAVKEELDKLMKVGFIYPLEKVTWLLPIVVVPKKNGKLRICVDYRKLNAATITDPFPLPFQDTLLDAVAEANDVLIKESNDCLLLKQAILYTAAGCRRSSYGATPQPRQCSNQPFLP